MYSVKKREVVKYKRFSAFILLLIHGILADKKSIFGQLIILITKCLILLFFSITVFYKFNYKYIKICTRCSTFQMIIRQVSVIVDVKNRLFFQQGHNIKIIVRISQLYNYILDLEVEC